MLITITTDNNVFPLEVDQNETIENLKALIEVETNVPLAQQVLLFEGKALSNEKGLMDCGVKAGDLLQLQRKPVGSPAAPNPATVVRGNPPPAANDLASRLAQSLQQGLQQSLAGAFRPNPGPSAAQRAPDAEQFRNYIISNPQALEQLSNNDPNLADMVFNGTTQQLQQLLNERAQLRQSQEQQRQQLEAQLAMDPYNVELQKKIEAQIQQEAIDSNMEQAIEYTPESFGRVTMLYIDSEVNNMPIKAFVDSGAQQTIMSASAARRFDKRFQGIAKGVGTARILGRVHLTQIKIGSTFFPISITILEDPSMDFLLGLDMLKRHQEKVPFLAEKDLPAHLRDSAHAQDELRRSTDSAQRPTATTSTASTANSGAPTSPSHPPPPEEVVQNLMAMGFPRDAVLRALTAANGNADAAVQMLLRPR